MIQDFTKEEERLHDPELTLGGGTVLVLGGGLVILCTLCFVLGYSLGHRNAAETPVANVLPPPQARSSSASLGSASKPAAAGQFPSRTPSQVVDDVQAGSSSDSTPPAQLAPANAESRENSSQSHAPAPAGAASPNPSSFQIMPPMAKIQGWMVQIASVSNPEDAEVLVSALRRRGYSVTARRDNADTLIHVQTGPFVNRNDANAMRQKLLNDGYNAIVQ